LPFIPGVAKGRWEDGEMVQITNASTMRTAVEHAHSVELAAYLLRPGSRIVGALEEAARNGAEVHVRVDGNPYRDEGGTIARASADAARELRAHGVDARVVTDRGVHLKAAVIDGRAFLDDRNWTAGGHDAIVASDDADDVALVRDAIETGRSGVDAHLATGKYDALRFEADMIAANPSGPVDAASEGFGYSKTYSALRDRAKAGGAVRLIVSESELRGSHVTEERRALQTLAKAGVEIRVGSSRSGAGNEKLAIAGDQGWVGSANATYGGDSDWGLRTSDPRLVDALQQRFDDNWRASRPYVA
jgi:phosphatidylserine/phosphatidylglycerophosphate/cardiolipin synthase-like enzyme